MFDEALAVYFADQRHYDAVLIQLYVTDCLLQLGRYDDVLIRCAQIRPLFDQIGATLDTAKTMLNEGIAYAGLRHSLIRPLRHCVKRILNLKPKGISFGGRHQ